SRLYCYFHCFHRSFSLFSLFFLLDAPSSDIYSLSLHDALPIWTGVWKLSGLCPERISASRASTAVSLSRVSSSTMPERMTAVEADRKSTRLNSSHVSISYAVFCLKKKKETCDSTIILSMQSI